MQTSRLSTCQAVTCHAKVLCDSDRPAGKGVNRGLRHQQSEISASHENTLHDPGLRNTEVRYAHCILAELAVQK